jgi:hypothetical protein
MTFSYALGILTGFGLCYTVWTCGLWSWQNSLVIILPPLVLAVYHAHTEEQKP